MKNIIIIESSDIKFVDFYNDTQISVITKFYGEDWVYEVRELKNLIEKNGAENDITFSDDSLILIAYNVMIRVGNFTPKLYHWWIVRRYIEVYQSRDYKEMQDLYDFINITMSMLFADMQLDENGLLEYEKLKENVLSLRSEGFELPEFLIKHAKKAENKEVEAKVSKTIKNENKNQKTEENDIIQQWKDLIPVCELMIESTEGEEKTQWEELLETCKIMIE
jgi:hypothetical protein